MHRRAVVMFGIALVVCAAAGGAYFLYAAPYAQAVALENCALTEGTAPGPCSFGGVVLHTPVPCLGTGMFLVTIMADVTGAAAIPLQLVVGPSEFPYYMMSHTGQFVLGVAEGQVGRCLTSPHTLVSGLAETGFPLVYPAAYYGTSL